MGRMGVLFRFCGGGALYESITGGRGCEGNVRPIVLVSVIVKADILH